MRRNCTCVAWDCKGDERCRFCKEQAVVDAARAWADDVDKVGLPKSVIVGAALYDAVRALDGAE